MADKGLGSRNADGRRILDFSETYDLAITNTFFKKWELHLVKYESCGCSTQIDYWLAQRADLKAVMDAKVIPSDHVYLPSLVAGT